MNTINLKNQKLQNDNVFVNSQLVSLSQLTGHPVRKGLEKALLSENRLVNIVSKSYGHLPNEHFFTAVEAKLIDADIQYITRSINRDNRSFAVDYILNDESFHIKIKNGADKIRPMLRFTNSYDGSGKTSGHFGFFREVCSNGLHVAHSNLGFSIKHRGNVCDIVLPEISGLVKRFLDNEYYSLHRKFEVLAEKPIKDVSEFVKFTLGEIGLFKYEASEKNPEPSKNARIVIDTIYKESNQLGQLPNMWLGYNAFNEVLHGKLKKTFDSQKQQDSKIFNTIYEMATN